MREERLRARRRILSALDEIVAQCTVQAALLERQDGAAPVLVSEGVVEWVRRVAQALILDEVAFLPEEAQGALVDLVVEEKVAVEVKRVRRLTEEHRAQLEAYLRDGGWAVGLLVNFGGEKLQWRRVYVAANDPTARRGDATATEKPDGGR